LQHGPTAKESPNDAAGLVGFIDRGGAGLSRSRRVRSSARFRRPCPVAERAIRATVGAERASNAEAETGERNES